MPLTTERPAEQSAGVTPDVDVGSIYHASFNVEILKAEESADGDRGRVEAIVSAFNVDYRMGFAMWHRVTPAAFDESIAANDSVPLFWMHNWDWSEQPPIGTGRASTVTEPKPGLKIVGDFFLDTDAGRSTFRAIKAGALREWSIGYRIQDFSIVEDDEGRRVIVISRADLWEASSVLRGANPQTETLSVARGLWPSLYEALVDVAVACPMHHTDTVETPWDGGANEKRLPSPMSLDTAKAMYGWYDNNQASDGKIVKAACKLPHHMVSENGTPGAANLPGVRNALARLPQSNIPMADHPAIRAHLQAHLDDAAASFVRSMEATLAQIEERLNGLEAVHELLIGSLEDSGFKIGEGGSVEPAASGSGGAAAEDAAAQPAEAPDPPADLELEERAKQFGPDRLDRAMERAQARVVSKWEDYLAQAGAGLDNPDADPSSREDIGSMERVVRCLNRSKHTLDAIEHTALARVLAERASATSAKP